MSDGKDEGRMVCRPLRIKASDLSCPVDRISKLFSDIFSSIGISYDMVEADEWAWEDYLEDVNRRMAKKLEPYSIACMRTGIPDMRVNMYTDGKTLRIVLKMSFITFPSEMSTGTLFDRLKDFVLGCILSPNSEEHRLTVRLDTIGMTAREVATFRSILDWLNAQDGSDRYELDDPYQDNRTSVLMDLDYLDSLADIDCFALAERLRDHYPECSIVAYGSGRHRAEWREFMEHGIELENVLEAPRLYRGYDPTFKLAIDAVRSIPKSERIVIVSGDRNLIQLSFPVHKAGKKIEFVLPDEQTDINFWRHSDGVFDADLDEFRRDAL